MPNGGHLEIRDLSLTLGGRKVLDRLTLDLAPGRVHAVVGPSGAGKSALAAALMGTSGAALEGDVLLDGELIGGLAVDERARRGLTLMRQEPAAFDGLSVHEFVLAGARYKTPDTVRRTLGRVGLDPTAYLKRAVDRTLSWGERKRIEMASVLAMRPRVAMIDELDAGVDVESLTHLLAAVAELRQEGSTVLLLTRSTTVLRRAELAVLLCAGRVIEQGAVDGVAAYFDKTCRSCTSRDAHELEVEA